MAGANGPEAAEAGQAANVRKTVDSAAKQLVQGGMPVARASAKAIVSGAGDGQQINQRAATLKMLKHLYHEEASGGQQVWVYSPPSAYTQWIFDVLAGNTATALEDNLAKSEAEVYTHEQRAVMVSAVQEARAVALSVVAKLGTPNDATKDVVRRYFGNATTSAQALTATMTSTAFHQTAYMKSRLRPPCVVANLRHSYGYGCGLRLA